MLGKYGNIFARSMSPSNSIIISIIFTLFIVMLLAMTFIIILFVFRELGRMFSTFQIFGAQKASLLKLVVIQMVIYTSISGILSFFEIFALYKIFYSYISSVLIMLSVFSSIINFLYIFLVVFTAVIFGTVVFTLIFLTKDPYDSMRGSL